MIDNDFNKTQYQEHADGYLESNPTGTIGGGTPEKRAQLLTSYLPKERNIFEIGSAGGTDALALQQVGYTVTASDFVEPFVQKLQEQGLTAVLFDAKKDSFPQTDAIYANAVFVHFSPEEVLYCLVRAKQSLTNEKIVFMSVIKGEGQERSGRARGIERDFQYYNLQTISQLLQNAGYEVVYSNDTDPKWLQVVGRVK